MDDPSPYPANYHQSYASSSHRSKLPVRNTSYTQPISNKYEENDDEEDEEVEVDDEHEEEEEEEEEELEGNGFQKVLEEAEDEDEDEDEEEEDDDDEEDDDGDDNNRKMEASEDLEKQRKKRKLKNLALGYEFAPRVAAQPPPPPKPSFGGGGGGRNSLADWTEHATFVLLDAWGDRFLHLGRKSLRSEEWHEVAKKISQASKTIRTDTQCRNRLDTLKKKYKKEKMMLEETGGTTSKWVYFKKMDMLMTSSSSRQQPGLSCGLDSGEYVFMNPRVYLNLSNGMDEIRDSPGDSEASEGDDSDGLPPKRKKHSDDDHGGSSFRLLANSIQKFGDIYEKIENNKRQQMLELEKMRMEFHRDLELQKRQIMERAHAEIAKIRQGDEDEEIDVSTDNISG